MFYKFSPDRAAYFFLKTFAKEPISPYSARVFDKLLELFEISTSPDAIKMHGFNYQEFIASVNELERFNLIEHDRKNACIKFAVGFIKM